MPTSLLTPRPLPVARARQSPAAACASSGESPSSSAALLLSFRRLSSAVASTSERGPAQRRGDACVVGAKRRKGGKRDDGAGPGAVEAELAPVQSRFSTSLDWPEFTYDAYQLGNIMGQGSYGDVFEALDTKRGLVVAVKRMTKFRDSNSVEKTLFKLSREVTLFPLPALGSAQLQHLSQLDLISTPPLTATHKSLRHCAGIVAAAHAGLALHHPPL